MGQAALVIPEKIYFKIGEVCDLVGVQAHVLRYWETEFPMLSPQKNRSGQRSYRRRDVEISIRIKELLYEEMFTIAGAKKKLQSELREMSRLKVVNSPAREKPDYLRPVDAPSLFEDNLELPPEAAGEQSASVTESRGQDQREALKSLAHHLLELREILRSGRRD